VNGTNGREAIPLSRKKSLASSGLLKGWLNISRRQLAQQNDNNSQPAALSPILFIEHLI
jgi:hypothetical protein